MTEDALPLKIEIAAPNGQRMHVTCLDVLRDLGRTRRVYSALWQERPIIIKVFTKWPKTGYHALREWRGLRQLETRGLNTPRPLFYGRIPNGWAVATERIEGAVTARDLWEQTDTLERKEDLLCRVAAQLAQQHARGVTQSDLHLGNFLIRGDVTYILDPAMMHFGKDEVGRSRSIKQVALLTAILSERAGPVVDRVFHHYAAVRTWAVQAGDLEQLHRARRRYRWSAIERGIRKFLRTNKRHQAIRHDSWSGLAERAFLQAAGIDGLTTGLEEAMSRGRILKDGKTSFVSHTTLGGCDVVIKRYNHKGLLHSLRHTLKGSRARQGWVNANRLRLLGIPTPRSLAYIDEFRGPLLWRSYFVTEFVDAPPLSQLLQDSSVAEGSKQTSRRQVLELLDRLAAHNITHGDTKHSNILISTAGPVLTDLDAMRVHKLGWTHGRGRARDTARFGRDYRPLEQPQKGPNT